MLAQPLDTGNPNYENFLLYRLPDSTEVTVQYTKRIDGLFSAINEKNEL